MWPETSDLGWTPSTGTPSLARRRWLLQQSATLLAALAPLHAARASGKIRVEFWTMSLRPKFTPYFSALIKRYEAANPGVKIEWVDVPWDVMQTKLTSAIVAGSPPALAQLNVPWAYDYAQQGALLPLEGLVGAGRDQFNDGALKDLTFQDHLYGLPSYNGVSVMACNSTLFKQAGIQKPPRNLPEQLAVSKIIRAKTGQAGCSPSLGKIANFFLEQGLPLLKDKKAVFNSPAHVALIRSLAEAHAAGALLRDAPFDEDNYTISVAAYKAGRMAMLVSPPSGVVRIRDDAPDIYAHTTIAPAPEGGKGITPGGWLMHFVMPRGTPPDVAREAIRFGLVLTNDENQLAFAKLSGTFPTAKGAAKNLSIPEVVKQNGAYEAAMSIGAASMDAVRTLYVSGVPSFRKLNKRLQLATDDSILGNRDAQAALDDAVAFWNSKIQGQ